MKIKQHSNTSQYFSSICIVIAQLIISRAEGPGISQLGNKIVNPPLNSYAENVNQILAFYQCHAYFRRKIHVISFSIRNSIEWLHHVAQFFE